MRFYAAGSQAPGAIVHPGASRSDLPGSPTTRAGCKPAPSALSYVRRTSVGRPYGSPAGRSPWQSASTTVRWPARSRKRPIASQA
eukprot:6024012-Alexandrium_andersonii.AAC.1